MEVFKMEKWPTDISVGHFSILTFEAGMGRLYKDWNNTELRFWLFIVATLVDIQVACTVEREMVSDV